MQPSTSRAYTPERSPTRKNKTQSQREYRSKETDGFSELRDALLLVDPFESPLGRDATRHQLLVTAAKKLRNLADENQKLVSQLSAMPTAGRQEAQTIVGGMTAQNISWQTDVERLLSMAIPPHLNYDNAAISGWSHSQPLLHGQDMALGSPYQIPTMDMWRFQ